MLSTVAAMAVTFVHVKESGEYHISSMQHVMIPALLISRACCRNHRPVYPNVSPVVSDRVFPPVYRFWTGAKLNGTLLFCAVSDEEQGGEDGAK